MKLGELRTKKRTVGMPLVSEKRVLIGLSLNGKNKYHIEREA